MKVCFDTSTLVAALLKQHPHHAIAFPHLKAAQKGTIMAHLTTHALAELFATLTALPLKPRLSPTDVQRLLDSSILPHFTIIALSGKTYKQAITLTAAQHLASGAIYDAQFKAFQSLGSRRCDDRRSVKLFILSDSMEECGFSRWSVVRTWESESRSWRRFGKALFWFCRRCCALRSMLRKGCCHRRRGRS